MLYVMIRDKSGLIERKKLANIDDDIVSFAREKILTEYREVVHGSFDDDLWKLNNQSRVANLRFSYLKDEIIDICHSCNIDYYGFINSLKTVVALRLGTCDINDLRNFVKYALDEFRNSEGLMNMIEPSGKIHGQLLMHYIEFITLLPYTEKNYIQICKKKLNAIRIKNIEEKGKRNHPCVLNEFRSYFLFTDIINEYWSRNCRGKEYYYPLYLFWIITTILPMRVTEFCVTPYDCIRKDGEVYYLTIRRSHLKGSSSLVPKIHYYTINEDYDMYEYEIPQWMYDLIYQYRELTKTYTHPYDLLLSVDYALSFDRQLRTSNVTKVFSTLELSEMIKDFYNTVICEEYGYSIITEQDLLNRYMVDDGSYEMAPDEVMVLQAKHTRHLAMVNLVMRGCNPVMIKEFAGHSEEVTSAHYYGNISKTIRCTTKLMYDKMKNRKSLESGFIQMHEDENPLSLLIDNSKPSIEVDCGRCYSEKFISGSSYDCGKVDGNCMLCKFLKPNKNRHSEYKGNTIDSEFEYIMKMLQSKTITDKIEEFQLRTQLLETHIANYATQCWRELVEVDHGTQTQI